jgi:hypothetical protein
LLAIPFFPLSDPHALDFAIAEVTVAPVVEAGGFGARMPGHALRPLDPPTVRQIIQG